MKNSAFNKKPVVPQNNTVSRMSISLPDGLLNEFDKMVKEKGFDSRSQTITDMIHQQLNDHKQEVGLEVMAGTINLVFDHSIEGVQKQLSQLQHFYIDEIISSLNVNLMHSQTLMVILVQGPAKKLQMIANKMKAIRGVVSGKLLMSTAILPPIHPISN